MIKLPSNNKQETLAKMSKIFDSMIQQQSFQDMAIFFGANHSALKDFTFIVATPGSNNMDLYDYLENMEGVQENLFTPFCNGRVSIINDRILKRVMCQNDSRTIIDKCISFDTQTISYIERYYRKGEAPLKNFVNVIKLLNRSDFGVDYIPYVLENSLFNPSRKDFIENSIFAFEMIYNAAAQNEEVCRKKAKKIVDDIPSIIPDQAFDLYITLYLSLLKMCQIQLRHSGMPIDKKMKLLVEFMASELRKIELAELNLAMIYFSKGNSCGFFGKIQKSNKDIITTVRNMTWDLMHLKFLVTGSAFIPSKEVDALIPYFFTYDRRLLEIKSCYELKALAINNKNLIAIPFYSVTDTLEDYVKEYCTVEKSIQRASKMPDLDEMILENERALRALTEAFPL